VARIASHLGVAPEEFAAKYLVYDEEEGARRFKSQPCPFLGEDSRCTIYDVRPDDCRGYPFTDRHGFVFRSISHANNAVVCPGVFYIVEELKLRMKR
jgi:Fe-S-cluster containining protein